MPEPILPPLAPGQVLRIGPTAGTGTPTSDYDIGATDLCEFMEFPSGILQVCGDSFAGQGVGFGPWHSPIALYVETESIDDQSCLRYDRVTGNDKPLLAEQHRRACLNCLRAWCRSTARTTCSSPP
jgi:hypothetical protein